MHILNDPLQATEPACYDLCPVQTINTMPKIVDHEARKAEISRMILRAIAKQGINNVTVRSIAKEGGVSSGTLAHYFSNKNEMINFAIEALTEGVYVRIGQRMAACRTAMEKIRVIVDEHLPSPAEESMAMISLAFWSSAVHDAALAERFVQIYDRWRGYLERHLREAVKLGEIAPVASIKDEVDLIVALTDGFLVSYTLNPQHFSAARRARMTEQIFARLTA